LRIKRHKKKEKKYSTKEQEMDKKEIKLVPRWKSTKLL